MHQAPLKNALDKLYQRQTKRPAIRNAGVVALVHLLRVAQRDTGQSSIVARFLLGLYNGPEHPFDLTTLRSLDADLFDNCIAVLRLDNSPEHEVHTYVANGDAIWQDLRRRWV
ncbi:hypothetical protein HX870_24430 [Pseudomonas gingeri]|uniref:DUF7673 family protein n=1 Tax=Pseudomonas gingeri TaxID=117681 RepID=UPI0015A3D918|nr:hypothetical protein [Pseudomonas gingeri]NWD70750.1 hypothetical protein [Pseudomonas gingeri]